jgi:uncharacterized membrane protein
MLPPIPSWDGLHPLIIHFPIALLIVAPVLALLGTFIKGRGRVFLMSALVLMILGSLAAWFAVSTGEAASEFAERAGAAQAVLEEHEELAETTRAVFTVLTGVFAVIVVAPLLFRKELARSIVIPLNLAFLLFYGAGILLLVNTAHQGGRLVHEYGVLAMTTSSPGPATNAPPQQKHEDDDD